jgi:hypothetical protein
VTFIWLGLGLFLLGLALLSISGLLGSGESTLSTWGFRIGLLLMFAGVSLSLLFDWAL